jgi:hypothetical protein
MRLDYFSKHCQIKLCLKDEKCSGGKLSKKRLTIFFCGFMTGEIPQDQGVHHHHHLQGLGLLAYSDLPVRRIDPSISSVVDDVLKTWTLMNFLLYGNQIRRLG